MVDVEVLLRFVVDVDFELGDVVLGFRRHEHVIGGIDLKFLPFTFRILVFLPHSWESTFAIICGCESRDNPHLSM